MQLLTTESEIEQMSKTPQSAAIIPGPGFRIRTTFERPSKEVIDRIAAFETPDVSDLLNRMFTMNGDISGVVDGCRVAGPALTVKVYPGDNLMVHKALDLIQPGDVVVIDTSESNKNAVLGDLITNKAKHKGVAGFVIDGLVRDIDQVRESGIPVFCRGITPFGPLHRGPGELNHSISCGGIVVEPGDIITADNSGIVVVRRDYAERLAEKLEAKSAALADYIENVKKGIFSQEWVDTLLAQTKCSIDED